MATINHRPSIRKSAAAEGKISEMLVCVVGSLFGGTLTTTLPYTFIVRRLTSLHS